MQYSIVNYKTVKENSDFRIDAEYFRPDYLDIVRILKDKNSIEFGSALLKITSGATPLGAEYHNEGIPFLRVQNIMQNYLNDNLVYISEKYNNEIKRSILKENDVLLTITGVSYGKSTVVEKRYNKANINQHSVLMRFKKELNPYFVSTFLNCYFGKKQSDKNIVGLSRPALDYKSIKKLFLIPVLSNDFQSLIEKVIKNAHQKLNYSKSLYSQAEELLLSELGLSDWESKHELTFIKNFSDTKKAERIDAEYFQPKYEEIIEAVKKYKGGFDWVSRQFEQNKESSKKQSDEEYKYIEIGCVNTSDGSMEPIILQGSELPANAKIKFKKDNILVSKVRPYRGAIGIVDNNDYIGSGAFTVLQENGVVNKETLFVFLRLKPMLDFSLKFNTGTSYPVITDKDVLNFPLPKIDPETQKEIKEKIIGMYETKKLSKPLLEIAKRGVEMAIEKDEQEAEKWIQNELTELGIEI